MKITKVSGVSAKGNSWFALKSEPYMENGRLIVPKDSLIFVPKPLWDTLRDGDELEVEHQ